MESQQGVNIGEDGKVSIESLMVELNEKEKKLEASKNSIIKLMEHKKKMLLMVNSKDPELAVLIHETVDQDDELENQEVNHKSSPKKSMLNVPEIETKATMLPVPKTSMHFNSSNKGIVQMLKEQKKIPKANTKIVIEDYNDTHKESYNKLIRSAFMKNIKEQIMSNIGFKSSSAVLEDFYKETMSYYSGESDEIKFDNLEDDIISDSKIIWNYVLCFPNPDYDNKIKYMKVEDAKELYNICFWPDRRTNSTTKTTLAENEIYQNILESNIPKNRQGYQLNNGKGLTKSIYIYIYNK